MNRYARKSVNTAFGDFSRRSPRQKRSIRRRLIWRVSSQLDLLTGKSNITDVKRQYHCCAAAISLRENGITLCEWYLPAASEKNSARLEHHRGGRNLRFCLTFSLRQRALLYQQCSVRSDRTAPSAAEPCRSVRRRLPYRRAEREQDKSHRGLP